MDLDGGHLADVLGVGIRKAFTQADGIDHPLVDFVELIPADTLHGLFQARDQGLARAFVHNI